MIIAPFLTPKMKSFTKIFPDIIIENSKKEFNDMPI